MTSHGPIIDKSIGIDARVVGQVFENPKQKNERSVRITAPPTRQILNYYF